MNSIPSLKAATTLGCIALGVAAVLLGQITATAADAKNRERKSGNAGEGGVAGGAADCGSASSIALGDTPFDTTTSTVNLQIPPEAPCGAHTIFKSVFFRFTAEETGLYTFETCGNDVWDTRIAILNDCDVALGVIGCDDDGCAWRSRAGAALVAGNTYRVAIGAYYENDGGVGVLKVTEPTGGGIGGPPDVIVGGIPDVSKYGSTVSGGVTTMAYSFGTTSCNIGTGQLSWYGAPDNRHPFIPMNMYRYKGGRLEQIGMSWGKHGFCALQGTLCSACIPAGDGCPPILGVGCSDPYSSDLNGSQGGLGTRKEVNAATGAFPGSFNAGMPAASATIGRRLQVLANDLNPAMNANAQYLAEGQYIHPEDAAANNDNNNASWRQLAVGALSAGAYTLTLTGNTKQQQAGIEAWKTFNPAVTLVNTDVVDDGRFITAFTVTNNGNGTWRYEYAVQNLNSDRSARSLSLPIPAGVTVSNAGFHDINYHSGDPYDPTDWSINVGSQAVTWSGGTYAVNVNGNALRFATLYNFWFDANQPPADASATLGLFKPGAAGAPTAVYVPVQGPAAPAGNPADLNGDGVVNAADLAMLLGKWGNAGVGDINGDSVVNAADVTILLGAWQ